MMTSNIEEAAHEAAVQSAQQAFADFGRAKDAQLAAKEAELAAKDAELAALSARPPAGGQPDPTILQVVLQVAGASRHFVKQFDAVIGELKTALEMIYSRDLEIKSLKERLLNAESKLAQGEEFRKIMQNTILELKGKIRVFCRVRPSLTNDSSTYAQVAYPDEESLGCGIDLMQNGQQHRFIFDKVFKHDASQQDVFGEISELVESVINGNNVCIFAYGQVGSGKTYTMMGTEAPEKKGLIPRSLEQIFEASQSQSFMDRGCKLQVSMLEIYNEKVMDLIELKSCSVYDDKGNVYVKGLTVVDVSSIEHIFSILKEATGRRRVAKTQMNEKSSRSHFVFTLQIEGPNQQLQGVLNLIDLAGSERCTDDERLKKTTKINQSLLALSNVISALSRGDNPIYRNSNLTRILKNCFERNGKVIMFVNISRELSSVTESLRALRFAEKVNNCQIGAHQRTTISSRVVGSGGPHTNRRHFVGSEGPHTRKRHKP